MENKKRNKKKGKRRKRPEEVRIYNKLKKNKLSYFMFGQVDWQMFCTVTTKILIIFGLEVARNKMTQE